MSDKDKILIEQIKQAQNGQFGLKAIKIEFEAKFGRGAASTASRLCDTCEGTGVNRGRLVNGSFTRCAICIGHGRIEHPLRDMAHLHDLILAKLVRSGLAERIPKGQGNNRTDGHKYRPKAPLMYSKVYEDGSVDTEQTLTLSLDKPENILLLPKLSNAFYALKDVIGEPVDVSNAGMHMALLSSTQYPTSPKAIDYTRFNNFRRSMILLLPAIYFLGSSSERCRSLSFRKPDVSDGDKYSAIAFRGGALEFRVFETCYDNPDMMFDNVAVMLNCLKFWTQKYTRNHLAKVANNIRFGKEGNPELKRLYVTNEHIDLLNRGLRMIKPQWRSVTELKKQRNFTITKTDVKSLMDKAKAQAEAEYKAYEERFSWQTVMQRNNYINRRIEEFVYSDGNPAPIVSETVLKEMEAEADKMLVENKWVERNKTSKPKFCEEAINKITKAGDYRLAVV